MAGAQFVFGAPPGKRIVAAKDHHAIDKAVRLEQWNPLRLNHPGDLGIGETVL